MVEQATSWIKENTSLVVFLVAQVIGIGAAGAAFIAYAVKLETRVEIMETRGAEYSVARMAKMEERITVIEQRQSRNEDQIKRLIDEFIKTVQRIPQVAPPPQQPQRP
jgi:hypothetical protein